MDKNVFNFLLNSMRENQAQMFGDTPEEAAAMEARMKALLATFANTAGGADTLRFLETHDISFRWSRDVQNAQYCYRTMPNEGAWGVVPGSKCVLLNPDIDDTGLISAIIHESRHARQAEIGMFQPVNNIPAHEAAWLNRFVEADAQSLTVLETFKMKVAGNGAAFEAAKMFGYEDMFAAAEEGYAKDPSSLNDGRLRRAIFDAWFSPVTKTLYDTCIISDIYPRRMALLQALPEHGLQKIPLSVQDIEKIGVCGGETVNYMTLPGFRPLTDDHYLEGFTDKNIEALEALKKTWDAQPVSPVKKQQMSPGGP